jgi:hypothetical protein
MAAKYKAEKLLGSQTPIDQNISIAGSTSNTTAESMPSAQAGIRGSYERVTIENGDLQEALEHANI